jgi:hypothetical protein
MDADMKFKIIYSVFITFTILLISRGYAGDNIKYSQCLNKFKEKDGIQTGSIIKMTTGEVFETLSSSFSYDKNLVSPLCSIIKYKRYYYILIGGVDKKILAKKLN